MQRSAAQKQCTAEPAAVQIDIDRQSPKTKHRHIVAPESFRRDHRCPAVLERGWAQRIEAKDARPIVGQRRHEAFRPAALVILPGIALQVEIEVGDAAVESLAVVAFAERLFLP
jgi:hypothetical protein